MLQHVGDPLLPLLIVFPTQCTDFNSRILFLRHFGFVTLEEGEKDIIVEISVDVRNYEGRLWTRCPFCRFVMSFHRFCTAILLVDSTHRFLSSSRVGIKLKWPKSKNFRLESPCRFDDSSAGFFVLLRVRLATDHIGSPSFVILTFRRFVMAFGRFDSSTKAPSTHIRIFLNAQLFLSGLKNFPVHT